MSGTQLAFRTQPGGQVIQPGTTLNLTAEYPEGIPVQCYQTIRVVLVNRSASASIVTFSMTINQNGELIYSIDQVTLQPGAAFTQTYDIPGIGLTIEAAAASGTGIDVVDVLVYGFVPYTHIVNHYNRNCC
jgi:hypothetical protein